MTLLGLVVLSHTPMRAVRGSVLSTGLAAGAWAKLALAVASATVNMAVHTNRFRIRIRVPFRTGSRKSRTSILNRKNCRNTHDARESLRSLVSSWLYLPHVL